MLSKLSARIEKSWYQAPYYNIWLWPLSVLFFFISHLRRIILTKLVRAKKNDVPVVVVGNIAVGGTGKTPLTSFLIDKLAGQQINVAVISRGYGGKLGAGQNYPLWLDDKVTAEQAGDEPKLLAQRHHCPVVVGSDRQASVQSLIEQCQKRNIPLDLIICDDGLQHYKLQRDYEIVLLDATRSLKPNKVGLGNGWLLPAGPLREGAWRLNTVDCVLLNGQQGDMQIEPICWVNAKTLEQQSLSYFANQQVHGVAGIGNPQRFYSTLATLSVVVKEHSFADHFAFEKTDINFSDDLPVVMTEKDWIKCSSFVSSQHWYLKISASLSPEKEQKLIQDLSLLCKS